MREWWKIGLVISVAVLVLYCTAVGALAMVSYRESKKPDPPAPVIQVVEVDDPRLATALMVIGEQQVEVQNLINLHANYANLLDLYQQSLIEAIRKVAQR